MKNKKGQIAIFILLGIVILIAVSLLFYINQEDAKKSAEVEQAAEVSLTIVPIKNYVESCIKSVGEDALEFIGQRGGYYDLPDLSTKDYFAKTAYYFYETEDVMPSIETISKEISKYMDNMLFFCFKNFIDFKEQGFKIEQGETKTETIIQPTQVTFEVSLPLTIQKGEDAHKISEFLGKVENVRFRTLYEVSKNITEEQVKHSDYICLSCISDLAIENKLYVDIERLDYFIILFYIIDNNSIINDEPYEYVFANKYTKISCSNVPDYWSGEQKLEFISECLKQEVESGNYSLQIEEIPDLTARVNEEFTYYVNASGIDLVYSDFTSLFDIDENTGLIRFIPKEENVGNHTLWIHVQDDFENEEYLTFVLNIIE